MIRVAKSEKVPESLSTTIRYDGEDVQVALNQDQLQKCYLCERKRVTDYEIEHLRSRDNYPEKEQEWTNLFLGCGYCNRRKSATYDDILDPANYNVEEIIEQRMDCAAKKAIFSTAHKDLSSQKTVELLNRIHNGKNGLRTTREEQFFEYVMAQMNQFNYLIMNFLLNPSEENARYVSEGLQSDKEFLGFKYWTIMTNDTLKLRFASEVVWNKR